MTDDSEARNCWLLRMTTEKPKGHGLGFRVELLKTARMSLMCVCVCVRVQTQTHTCSRTSMNLHEAEGVNSSLKNQLEVMRSWNSTFQQESLCHSEGTPQEGRRAETLRTEEPALGASLLFGRLSPCQELSNASEMGSMLKIYIISPV